MTEWYKLVIKIKKINTENFQSWICHLEYLTCKPALRVLDVPPINHQICLKFQDMICYANNYNLVKLKMIHFTFQIWAFSDIFIKMYYNRALLLKEIKKWSRSSSLLNCGKIKHVVFFNTTYLLLLPILITN